MVFGIHDYRCPFARFRLKMTSKMIANGRFPAGDRLPDRTAGWQEQRRGNFGSASPPAFIVSCCAGSVLICWYCNAAVLAGKKEVWLTWHSGAGNVPSYIYLCPALCHAFCYGKNFMGDMFVHVILAAVCADPGRGIFYDKGHFCRDQR